MKTIFLVAAAIAAVMVLPAAYAVTNITDPKGDTPNSDFDIRQASFNGQDNPFIKVTGEAGGTRSTPTSPAFAYVYFFTDGSAYAIASHATFSDSNEGNGADDWHAHGFTASTDAGSHFACLTTANDDGKAKIYGHKAVLQGTDEDDLEFVATVEITPGEPTSSCPALVSGSALYVDPLDVASPPS
ncbi:MAG TPA: hypothetical protein VJP79_08250 [Nitrososphaera sp.]|nr:hypothetical protein [Nitrososphaera sp.]